MFGTRRTPLKLRIASPCSVSWAAMKGDDRVRHCAKCKLNVYNLHELRMSDVEKLLRSRTGRFCARIYQRQDGTVLTADCPEGLRKVRMRLAAGVVAAVAFVGAVFSTAIHFGTPGGISGFWARHAQYKDAASRWPTSKGSLYQPGQMMGIVASDSSDY